MRILLYAFFSWIGYLLLRALLLVSLVYIKLSTPLVYIRQICDKDNDRLFFMHFGLHTLVIESIFVIVAAHGHA